VTIPRDDPVKRKARDAEREVLPARGVRSQKLVEGLEATPIAHGREKHTEDYATATHGHVVLEPAIIADPGDAGTIDPELGGVCELTSAGVETRTLGDPTFRGQVLDLMFIEDGGDITITASSPVNQAGNTSLVTSDVGDHLRLAGFFNATDGWEWRVIANDGWTLS